jgi:hypothetical protein
LRPGCPHILRFHAAWKQRIGKQTASATHPSAGRITRSLGPISLRGSPNLRWRIALSLIPWTIYSSFLNRHHSREPTDTELIRVFAKGDEMPVVVGDNGRIRASAVGGRLRDR